MEAEKRSRMNVPPVSLHRHIHDSELRRTGRQVLDYDRWEYLAKMVAKVGGLRNLEYQDSTSPYGMAEWAKTRTYP